MLRLARLHGIREIRGDLVLDRTLFQPARTDLGVPPFDEAPEFRYNVIPDALLLNTNLLQLDLDSDGEAVARRARPAARRRCGRVGAEARRSRVRGLGGRLEDCRR